MTTAEILKTTQTIQAAYGVPASAVYVELPEARALVLEMLAETTLKGCDDAACIDRFAAIRALFNIDPDGMTRSLVAKGFYVHDVQVHIR